MGRWKQNAKERRLEIEGKRKRFINKELQKKG